MDITRLVELLPSSVKCDMIDFVTVKLKDGRVATRILLDRLLTAEEKNIMKSKHFSGLDCDFHLTSKFFRNSYLTCGRYFHLRITARISKLAPLEAFAPIVHVCFLEALAVIVLSDALILTPVF